MANLLAQDLAAWHDWVNSGALAAFAVFVCWGMYRLAVLGGRKALELGERYVRSTESLHSTLREAEDNRSELCARHAEGMEAVSSAVESGNACLTRLVEIHESPDEIVGQAVASIKDGTEDMHRMKTAALHACQMCRSISNKEFPHVATDVDRHCSEIERIINNGTESS